MANVSEDFMWLNFTNFFRENIFTLLFKQINKTDCKFYV